MGNPLVCPPPVTSLTEECSHLLLSISLWDTQGFQGSQSLLRKPPCAGGLTRASLHQCVGFMRGVMKWLRPGSQKSDTPHSKHQHHDRSVQQLVSPQPQPEAWRLSPWYRWTRDSTPSPMRSWLESPVSPRLPAGLLAILGWRLPPLRLCQ